MFDRYKPLRMLAGASEMTTGIMIAMPGALILNRVFNLEGYEQLALDLPLAALGLFLLADGLFRGVHGKGVVRAVREGH